MEAKMNKSAIPPLAPGAKKPKPMNSGYVLKNYGKYIKSARFKLALSLLLTLGGNVLSLYVPLYTGRAIDAVSFGAQKVDFSSLYRNLLLVISINILCFTFSFIQSRLLNVITKQTLHNIRTDLFDKIMRLPLDYFDKNQRGDILSKMTNDIDSMGTSVSTDLVAIINNVVVVAGSFLMMLYISPTLILIFCVIVPVTVIFTKIVTKHTRRLFGIRQWNLGRLNAHTDEILTGMKNVKAYNHETEAIRKYREINQEFTTSGTKAQYLSGTVMPMLNFLNNLGFLLIVIFGAFLILQNKIRIGNVSAFILYSKKFTGPINEIANIVGELQAAFAAAERVFLTIDELPESADVYNAEEYTNPKGKMGFEDVSFGYNEHENVLEGLNLEVDSGQVVAIVGPTGAGKTTIVNLIMRYYDQYKGVIFLDQHNSRDITRKSLRNNFGMVLQDSWTFTGTLRENIAYGNADYTQEEIDNAVRLAHAEEFVNGLNYGYDTVITDDPPNISHGQKQLISIARVFLLNPKLLILDEATSSIDTRTEIFIQQGMRSLMQEKTCFVIAHRLSTIKTADIIIVVDDGKIVEQGKHDELLERGGFYATLYNSQF